MVFSGAYARISRENRFKRAKPRTGTSYNASGADVYEGRVAEAGQNRWIRGFNKNGALIRRYSTLLCEGCQARSKATDLGNRSRRSSWVQIPPLAFCFLQQGGMNHPCTHRCSASRRSWAPRCSSSRSIYFFEAGRCCSTNRCAPHSSPRSPPA